MRHAMRQHCVDRPAGRDTGGHPGENDIDNMHICIGLHARRLALYASPSIDEGEHHAREMSLNSSIEFVRI
jgi:hypothetical protein